MYKNKKITVIMPAFNEEHWIAKSVKSVPLFVDYIIVIDDKSTDYTLDTIKKLNEKRIILIEHKRNQGVGGAIISGYRKVLDIGIDVAVVMGADGQMDPEDMPNLIEPVIAGTAGYTKGNRLANYENLRTIPKIRLLGMYFLTLVTRFCFDCWYINDSTCGYTAISKEVLMNLDLDKLYKKYGFPIDMLIRLNSLNVKVEDVNVKAIYNDEDTIFNILSYVPSILFLLIKLLFLKGSALFLTKRHRLAQ